MDSSEARLDRIEAQRPTDVSEEQWRQRYIPMNLINRGLRTLRSRGFIQAGEEGTTAPTGETEHVPEFLTNLRLSDLYDVPGEYVPMNPMIYSSVSAGNKVFLDKLISDGTQIMACLKNDQGDSILHLAAAWGHLELVKTIISNRACLLLEPNFKDELPLHVAARAGNSAVVKALVASITYFSARLSEEEWEKLDLYVVKDRDGDTPLHAALKGGHLVTAAFLVDADQQASFLANNKRISPLYMAVAVGSVSLVKEMLKTTDNDGLDSQLEGRKCLVHAALKARNTDILDVILKEDTSLLGARDEQGRTCLSFGAHIGYYDGVCNLLDRSIESVYECDDDGSFPIHMAAKNGHVIVVREIIKRCPDSKQLINKQGQNILHIAAKNGKYLLVYYLMDRINTKHLSVGQDLDGNTPLHLATINWDYQCLSHLILDVKRLYIPNKDGLTALDIAESKLKPNYIFKERLALTVLLHAHAIGGSEKSIRSLTRPSYPQEPVNIKEYINALLLVATLVATVTFAAGFTIPGGFNSSKPNLGRATMATNRSLFIFLVLDTLSMYSSVITIAILIWAQLGDPALVQQALFPGLVCLLFSVLCMPVAFFFGVVTAVGHVKGLLIVLSIITCIFIAWVLVILGSHVLLQLPHVHPFFGNYIMLFLNGDAYPLDFAKQMGHNSWVRPNLECYGAGLDIIN